MIYYPSLIIKKDAATTSIESLLEWLANSEKQVISKESILNQPHITLINQTGESIKIATIREVKEKLGFSTHYSQMKQYFIFLDAHKMTIPAQNALLKSIEEPPPQTQIVFITHATEKILGTIQSRCQIVLQTSVSKNKDTAKITSFYQKVITSSNGERITLAAQFKERQDALLLCDELIHYLHCQLSTAQTNITTSAVVKHIAVILKTKTYLESNSNVLLTLENCFFELS